MLTPTEKGSHREPFIFTLNDMAIKIRLELRLFSAGGM
jgi:hypothetical protein